MDFLYSDETIIARRILQDFRVDSPVLLPYPRIFSFKTVRPGIEVVHGDTVKVVRVKVVRRDRRVGNRRIHNRKVLDTLLKSLLADDVQIRSQAVQALGRLGDENAVPALCHILATDQSPEVRRSAAEALGMIGSEETEA